MSFKNYLENEGSLGAAMPEMSPPMVNKGTGTTASDEVKRTNMQPQVDAQELTAKIDKDHDGVLAIDSEIEHMDNSLPKGDNDTHKINQFRTMWDQLKTQWDSIKTSDNQPATNGDGLGITQGSDTYRNMMQQNPNMVPMPDTQQLQGPGTFGNV